MTAPPPTVLSTYHDIEDGWYLRLPESWDGRILVSHSSGSEEASVTFYTRGENGELPEPFLRITTITGANRETKAVRGNRFNLARQQETIYVAELLEANQGLEYGITEDEVPGRVQPDHQGMGLGRQLRCRRGYML